MAFEEQRGLDSPLPSESRGPRTGLVTLLFTDIVSSTALKQHLGDKAGATLIQEQRALVRGLLAACPQAEEIETAGDSFLLAFAKPSDAVRFALVLQSRLRSLSQPQPFPLEERIGIHVGEVVIEDHPMGHKPKDLYGIQLDTCARIMSLAKGGQVLMSRGVFDNARQVLKGEDIESIGALEWLNHGPYLLKGLEGAVEVCEVREAGQARAPGPPTSSEKAQRQVTPEDENVLGWRPAIGQSVPNTQWILERKLGEGGFGEVWKARHRKLKEQRVFKFCFQADRVRSLKREVTLLRLLTERVGEHPNIVRLYDIDLDAPPFYLEEEYVAGGDLKSWCEAQGGIERVSLEARLEIVAQAAEGLQAAHDAGVIHRDVKPGNILVGAGRSEDGSPLARPASRAGTVELQPCDSAGLPQAKLTDFGIGQVLSEEYLAGVTRAGFTQTMVSPNSSGTGTQLYMAPELLAGKPASPRSDVYSLGVVLFQVLAGDFARPVTTDWDLAIEDPLLREDLRLCFAGNPQERFGGASQLASHLRNLPRRRAEMAKREAERRAAVQAAYRRGMWRTASVAAVILAVVAILALFAVRQSKRANREAAKAALSATAEKQQRERAEAGEQQAQRLLYAANLNLAQQEWTRTNVVNIGRLVQLLNETAEFPARGFEWYYWQRLTHLHHQTLYGHDGGVYSVAFSPDARQIVSGGSDHTVRVWDVVAGAERLRLIGHRATVRSVAYSPDGRYVASAGDDCTVRIWDAANGAEKFTLRSHQTPVFSVTYSSDGQRIASADNRDVRVWDATTARPLIVLQARSTGIPAVAFSPDNQRLVTSSGANFLVWDLGTRQVLFTLQGHDTQVNCVAFSPDGARIITGSLDRTARLWDATDGRPLLTLTGHTAGVWSSVFSSDGRRIITAGDLTARVWDTASGKALFSLKGNRQAVRTAVCSPDGRWIATSSLDGTIRFWQSEETPESVLLGGHSAAIGGVAFSPDGARVATASRDKTVRVWDPASGQERLTLRGHEDRVGSVAFSPDGRWIVSGGHDRTARVWDAESGRERLCLKGHVGVVFSVAVSPEGRRIITGSGDQTAKVWQTATGEIQMSLQGHNGAIRSATFSPDGRRIVTGSSDGTAKIWDALSGELLLTLRGETALVASATFSPDGRYIAATAGTQAEVWDATTGRELQTLFGHQGSLNSLVFSPDGRRLLTGSWDGTAKVWDWVCGKDLLTLQGHGPVFSVAFSPDGKGIAAGGREGIGSVWQAASREEVAQWTGAETNAAQRLAAVARDRAATAARNRAMRAQDPGAIKDWLVLAPVSLATVAASSALTEKEIPGEAQLSPRPGDQVRLAEGERVWTPVKLEDYVLDFNQVVGEPLSGLAYAVCYIHSEKELTDLVMHIGSDDGARVTLNGKPIYLCAGVRSYVGDQDEVSGVVLRAGMNTLVFKVVNGDGDWMGSIRFSDASGQPVRGLRVTLAP